MKKLGITAVALLAMSGAAYAGVGDIVFTTTASGRVGVGPGTAPGAASILYTFADPDTRLSQITRGADGTWYVGDGRFPFPNTTDSGIAQITDLFGSPSASYLQQGNPVQNPVGVKYDPTTNSIITVSNPGVPSLPGDSIDAIFQVGIPGGGVSTLHTEVQGAPGTNFYAEGNRLIKDNSSNNFYVTALNGGVFDAGGPDGRSSTIWRLEYDGAGSYSLDESAPVVDFANSFTGFGVDFTQIRGIANVPGDNDLYVTDFGSGSVLKVELDASGNFVSLSQILTGLDDPEEIIYNEFTNQFNVATGGVDAASNASVIAFDLDGSNLTTLFTLDEAGDRIRGLYAVPTPGAMGLLAFGGLLATRRRR